MGLSSCGLAAGEISVAKLRTRSHARSCERTERPTEKRFLACFSRSVGYNTNMNQQEYDLALTAKADRWVAACGGMEVSFLHNGTKWLYVWNPATGEHGYLNLDTDIVEVSLDFSQS